jgi:hypothetical protein
MYYGQIRDLADSWEIFRRVELYNSNVSTQRGMGDMSPALTYWQFYDSEQRTLYRQGAQLFFTYLQYSTIVEKN